MDTGQVVFRRRDRRPIWRVLVELVWPRGGWARAAQYVQHRVRRLPDTPEKIARGIWAGVFTTFTPFYGMHFIVAASVAKVMRGNILAALMATFFGNPLTYVPIAATSLTTGNWLLGKRTDHSLIAGQGRDDTCGIGCQFANAAGDLWHNIIAVFTDANADWHGLSTFYSEVFYPYMVGGVLPGILAGSIAYYISVPLIRAYQNRRRKQLRAKLAQLQNPADDG